MQDAGVDGTCETYGRACNPMDQCGCPGGDSCFASNLGAFTCEPAGTGGPEEPCVDSADCAPGLGCLPHATTGGACARYCDADLDCESKRCRASLDGTSRTAPAGDGRPQYCAQVCDLLDPDGGGCGAGRACTVFGGTETEPDHYTDCFERGALARGEVCEGVLSCGAALTCLNLGEMSICASYCVVGDDSTCQAGERCARLASQIVIGPVEYGACVPLAQ